MATSATSATNALLPSAALGQDQFLQLLVTQLQNQDPLDPVSDTDFISQLAQFSSLQGIDNLNTDFDQVLQMEQLSGGTNLIGRTVQYALSSSAAPVAGQVAGVLVQNGQVFLQVGGAAVPLGSVLTVAPN